jgi:FkbM family methyltransferase
VNFHLTLVKIQLMKSHLPSYMKLFGIVKGAAIYGKAKYSGQEFCLTVPGLHQPILLRGKTSDRITFQKVFLEREYAFDLGFVPRTILDGGANVGYSSLFFAQLFPKALIVAIEPEEDNFRLLKHNTAGYPNIRPVRKALWPRRTHLAIENVETRTDSFHVREYSSTAECTVATCTIDGLLRDFGVERFDLVKLDVEGAEKELFEDPSRESWLGKTRAMIMELHDRFKSGCTEAVEQAIRGHSFHRSQIGENILFVRESSVQPVLPGSSE